MVLLKLLLLQVLWITFVDCSPLRDSKTKSAIPCITLDNLTKDNVNISLPCTEEDISFDKVPCVQIYGNDTSSNSTTNSTCDEVLFEAQQAPNCQMVSGYDLTLPCVDSDECSDSEKCSPAVSSSAIEAKEKTATVPRNLEIEEKKYEKTEERITPDCVRLTDDLTGEVTACETVRNYPKELMKELVKEKNLEKILKKEVAQITGEPDENIVYNQVCRASAKVLHLQAAHIPESGWKYIVNIDDFVQAITIDKCSKEYEACAEIDRFLGFGFVSRCVQKNAVKNLFTLSSLSDDLELERFIFPSACVCQVHKMGAEVSLSYKDFTFKKIDSNLKNQEIFEAKIKTGDSYSAFCFNRLNGKEENQFAINATKYLKILRHPGILKYINCVKNSKNVYLLTEKVSPLPCKIETLDSVEIIAGVFDIIVAVSFLHEKCKLSHNNITVDSIFVTNEGKWKLGGMQYLSSFDTVSEVTLKTKDVFPCPEDDNENTESVKYKGHERDCYAIACLLRGILKDCVDENVLEHNISLFLNAEPSNRPQLASILENDFLRNNYIHIRNFLEKLTVMTNHEKNEFFKCAAKNIYAIPEDIVASKLSPLLFSQLVLLDTDAKKFLHPHIFTSYKERNKMFIDGETNPIFSISNFEKFVIPELFKIIKIKDATIRLVFLEYFNQFVHYIPKKSLQHEVLPELLLGLKDTNDVLVSATLRAMADLIPILGGSIVIGDNQSKIFTCALPKANACVSEKQVILQNSSQRKKSKKRAKEKPILETSSNLDNLKSEALEIPITSTPICNDWSKAIPERSSPDGGEDLKVEKISSNTEVANNDWSDWESMGSEDEINNSPSVLEVEPVKTLLELSDDVNIEPISEPMNKSNSMQLNRKPLKLSTPTPVVVKTPDVKEKSDDKKSLGEEFNIFSSFDMQNSEVDLFEGMQPVINKRQEIAVIQPISNTNSFAAVIEDTEQAESGWGDDLNWDPIS